MTELRLQWLGWSVAGLSVAMLAVGIVFAALNGFANSANWGSEANVFALCVSGLAASSVGALIVTRHPRHGIAWICLGVALGLGLNVAASNFAFYALNTKPGSLPAGEIVAWFASWSWLLWAIPLLSHLTLAFPNGRPPSPRWRPVAWIATAGIALGVASEALIPGRLRQSFQTTENPLGIEGGRDVLELTSSIGFALLPIAVVAAAVSMVVRFRRASGVERAQIKWFALSATVIAALVAVGAFTFFGDEGPAARVGADLVTLAYAAPLVATGIAILRYRLYDIDVVINRTLVYGLLTATLAAVYIGIVLLLQLLLSGLTEDSGLAVAASTLAVAALVRPARARIQAGVDRRFFRSRYDAARTLEGFSARVRDEVELETLSTELRATVAETMRPAHVSVWLRQPS